MRVCVGSEASGGRLGDELPQGFDTHLDGDVTGEAVGRGHLATHDSAAPASFWVSPLAFVTIEAGGSWQLSPPATGLETQGASHRATP